MGGGRMGGWNRFGFSDQRSERESDASARLVARRRICWRGIPDRARSGSRRHDSSTTWSPAQVPAQHLEFVEHSPKFALSHTTSSYWEAFGRLRYDVMHAYLEPTRWVCHLDPTQWSKVNVVWPKSGLHTGALRQLSCLMQLNETRVSRVSWMSVTCRWFSSSSVRCDQMWMKYCYY